MNLFNILACEYGTGDGASISELTRLAINLLKIFIPIILIILGIIDLAKAVMANEEKEMKESQKRLIKRIIYALVVFFVISLVQLIFKSIPAKNQNVGTGNNLADCIACFTSDSSKCTATEDADTSTDG